MAWSDAARRAAIEARRRNRSRRLFHGTPMVNFKSIIQAGLKPNDSISNEVTRQWVNLTSSKDTAKVFATKMYKSRAAVLRLAMPASSVQDKSGSWAGKAVHVGTISPAHIEAVAVVRKSGKLGAWHRLLRRKR